MFSNSQVDIITSTILTIILYTPICTSYVNKENVIQSNKAWEPVYGAISDVENETNAIILQQTKSVGTYSHVTVEATFPEHPSKQAPLNPSTKIHNENKFVSAYRELTADDNADNHGFSRKRKSKHKVTHGFHKKNVRVRKEKANLKSKTSTLIDYNYLGDIYEKKSFNKNLTREKKRKLLKKLTLNNKQIIGKFRQTMEKNITLKGKKILKRKYSITERENIEDNGTEIVNRKKYMGLSIPIPENLKKNEERLGMNAEINTTSNLLNRTGGNIPVPSTSQAPFWVKQEEKTTMFGQKLHTVDDTYDFHYLNPHQITNQLRFISQQFSEDNITIEEEILGKTIQYKDIVMLKVTGKKTNKFNLEDAVYGRMAQSEKKIVFIVHGLSVMYIRSLPCLSVSEPFEELIGFYFDHLEDFDIFLIPMANPDGVAVKKSYWNKNLSPQRTCPGVALDRNFEIAWNSRRNMSSCSQQYPGPHPFSEPESRAVRSVFQRYGHRIIAYLHLHAGQSSAKKPKGDAILFPKGYELHPVDQKYARLKNEVYDALYLYGGGLNNVAHITVDSLHKWHGKVAGTSVDYAALVHNIPVSLELVMQQYKHKNKNLMDEVLTEIWAPALEAIFAFIKASKI